MSRGRGLFAALGVVLLAVIALVATGASRSTERVTTPLDPVSVGDDGLRAYVLLLTDAGLSVSSTTVVPARADRTTVVVFDDALSTAQRRALLAWVADGGALLVTDPRSSLHSGGDIDAGAGPAFGRWSRGTCTIGALAAVDGLDALSLDDEVAYPIGPDDVGCFGDARRAFVIERAQGAGRVTALGGPSPFVNRRIDEEGNAALALALAQRDGRDSVVLLRPELLAGDKTLLQLVPRRVWIGLAQLAAAFVALAWWRSRRLGAPPVEPDPVVVPGSELVVAAGALAARHRHVGHTAQVLRADARRHLIARAGLAPDAPTDVLDRVVSARAGVPAGTVSALLDGPDPDGAAALVELAASLDRLRQEVP